jgi:hypothetical protein
MFERADGDGSTFTYSRAIHLELDPIAGDRGRLFAVLGFRDLKIGKCQHIADDSRKCPVGTR